MNLVRRPAALLVAVAAVLSTVFLSPVPSGAQQQPASRVTMTVLSVNPSTPAITSTPKRLTITVALENTTGATLSNVTLTGERGDPITTQAALTASLSNDAARAGGRAIAPLASTPLTLTPGVRITTTFRTTTSRQDTPGRICLCLPAAVYPIDLTALTSVGGTPTVLGGTRTYLPSFDTQPASKVGVTWVWPLIDRPHRTTDGAVFTDDDLVGSVAGGRLDRALQVVQQAADAGVPLTLVIDPELLDELQVMSLGSYTVLADDGAVSAGTGQQVAAQWLSRLQAVLADHPGVDVELTPLADPDVTGLTRHKQSWLTDLSPAVAADVTSALGGHRVPTHTLAWPPTETATVRTLDRLVTGGAGTVLLDGARVRPSTRSGVPLSATKLRTSSSPVTALLTAPVLQRYVETVLNGSGTALPALVSELAIRVTQYPGTAQSAVLTAPRYVDPPSPDLAAQAIIATSRSLFTTPVSTADAVAELPASTARSSVRAPVDTSSGLSDNQLDTVQTVTGYLRPVESLLGGSPAGQKVVATLPGAVQRAESAAWSRAGSAADVGGGPAPGAERARDLVTQLSGYLSKVTILKPSSGSYTLASSDSPLPISVRNGLSVSVQIRMSVNTVGGLPGLPPSRIGVVEVAGNSTATFKIPTRVQRSGRIPVQAQLYTADNFPLGDPVRLSVHSTVLGTIGVVITVAAGVVLVLALLARYVRRVLRLRAKRTAPGAP